MILQQFSGKAKSYAICPTRNSNVAHSRLPIMYRSVVKLQTCSVQNVQSDLIIEMGVLGENNFPCL